MTPDAREIPYSPSEPRSSPVSDPFPPRRKCPSRRATGPMPGSVDCSAASPPLPPSDETPAPSEIELFPRGPTIRHSEAGRMTVRDVRGQNILLRIQDL